MTDRRSFLLQTAGALTGIVLLPEAGAGTPPRLVAPRRVGVIGVGRQGRAIIGELQKLPDVTVAMVCDISPARLRTARDRAPSADAVADYRQVLERADLDAVLLSTPTHLHASIALEAISAGKPLWLEAPIAHTLDDVHAILGAARNARAPVYPGLLARANPLYQRAFSFIGSDSLRDPVSLTAQSNRKTSWRVPASEPGTDQAVNWRLDPAVSLGLAGELGTHQFDVALRYLGEAMPSAITGHGAIRLWNDGRTMADSVQATLVWPNGVALQWQATLANSFGGQYEVLHAEHAAIKTSERHAWLFKEADAPTQGWEVYATKQPLGDDEGIVLRADATQISAQSDARRAAALAAPSLYHALADFISSVDTGTLPVVTMEMAARATVLGILASQAIRTSSTITIPAIPTTP